MSTPLYHRESLRLVIPVPQDRSIQLVGTLERVEGNLDRGNKLALILHGALGHKDYLFQKQLGQSLPIDSFRFDFRGNHESTGKTKVANFDDDLEDIRTVVAYLVREYGYKMSLIIGHSRGSVIGLKSLCTDPGARDVDAYIIISGRYRMQKILELGPMLEPHFKKQGYYDRTVRVAGETVTVRSYPEDYIKFANWDNDYVWTQMPSRVDVLTIHGMKDEVVPVYDSLIWADALSRRSPGTHSLHLIENANHNLIGFRDEVVQVALKWWDCHTKKSLTGGIWKILDHSRL